MNNTWYDDTLINRFEEQEHLNNNRKCDVLIVGGGLAGLSLLYNLKKNNVDAVLIEENHIGSGASGRNGGFCLSGWAQDYHVLLNYLSEEEVVILEQISASGVKWVKKKCLSEGYEHTNLQSGVLKCFLTNNIEKVKNVVIAQNKLFDQNEEFINKEKLSKYVCSDKYTCGVFRRDSFQFHPLNFMHALARDCSNLGASIFEKCKFISYQINSGKINSCIFNNNGVVNIQSEKIVFATGGYGGKEIKDLKSYWLPIKTFIGVTKPMGNELQSVLKKPFGFSDNRRAGNYYRVLPGNRLSWGRG
ncbi:FAD-binding oxidoreductase, partial [Paracoccaceae bacterium]|nr:FAD-binding oxidoreductase [Paracoccaceae bacterium]